MPSSVTRQPRPLDFHWQTPDPFLFCIHHQDTYPKGNSHMGPNASLDGRTLGNDFIAKDGWRMYHGRRIPGFPNHPHRGFETITIVNKGLIDHADSLGSCGRYGNGDVQWVTTGKGLQHSEMFPLLNQEHENPFELFQIWLNLPATHKHAEPHYQMMWDTSIPKVDHRDAHDKSTTVTLIAGSIEKKKALPAPPHSWAAREENNVAICLITMEPNAHWTMPASVAGVNRSLYFYRGDTITIDGETIASGHSSECNPEVTLTIHNGSQEGRFLILQGRPIGEPVVQHGPFVMNTATEIQDAISDYQKTAFGGWPWPHPDPVHPLNAGRFARFADGHTEEP